MARQVLISSKSSIAESIRFSSMSPEEIAKDYLDLPLIPYEQNLKIDKIGVMNFDVLSKETLGLVTYKEFRKLQPESFPPCQDPNMDYEDDEEVSPVVIISGNTKYRTNQLLWFPLSDVVADITRTQAELGRKLLPITVFLDRKDQWMVPLLNLTRRTS